RPRALDDRRRADRRPRHDHDLRARDESDLRARKPRRRRDVRLSGPPRRAWSVTNMTATVPQRVQHRPSSGRMEAFRVRLRRTGELAAHSLRNPTTLAGAIVIALLVGMAVLAPLIAEPNLPNP